MDASEKILSNAMLEGTLSTYAIYDHPKDNPDNYVCVKWDAIEGQVIRDKVICESDNLEFIRNKLRRMGLYNLGNSMESDPVILEVWI